MEDVQVHWCLMADLEQRTHLRVTKIGLVRVGAIHDKVIIPTVRPVRAVRLVARLVDGDED
ncbi:hypothetical protein PanWU01x14_025830 [Parasponia andersonii]|uniref:Uncharacterized protein n=1 Tax=Parasponia andersonii TaxID=3476 RepID=A0A2P5DVU8_PARAD|nr:hypothetical protein PanWU01x14_025830 [Parasponia andersonii]